MVVTIDDAPVVEPAATAPEPPIQPPPVAPTATPPSVVPTQPSPVAPALPAAAADAATEESETIIVAPRPTIAPSGQPPAQRPAARMPGETVAGPPPVAPIVPPARTPVTPPADQPVARQPTMVTQAPPKPAQPTRHVEQRIAQPGDLICSNCNEPNDPSRRFCRRCGTSLVAAAAPAARGLPWYRRIFRRAPKAYAAGERAGSMRQPGAKGAGRKMEVGPLVRGVLGVLIALGVIGAVALPDVRSMLISNATGFIDDIRKFIAPTLAPVHPIGATASSETEGHEGAKLIDQRSNSDWQSGEANPSITLTFQTEVDLGAIFVHNGTAEAFLDTRRPSKLQFVLPNGSTTDVTLVDDHKAQQFELNANDVKEIEVRIIETAGPEGAPVALSEIEFFMKR